MQMPHLDLFTAALLIICACQIATLFLFIKMRRDKQTVTIDSPTFNIDNTSLVAWLDELGYGHNLTERLDHIDEAISKDGALTRKETQEIKTSLADEEKVDQKVKRQTRAKKVKARPAGDKR